MWNLVVFLFNLTLLKSAISNKTSICIWMNKKFKTNIKSTSVKLISHYKIKCNKSNHNNFSKPVTTNIFEHS